MKVKFMPQDIEVEIKPGQTIMEVAHANNIVIHSTCNGLPSCAECRVRITDGDWNTNPPSRKELGLIGTGYYIDQRRLSCQTLCFGDVTVDTSEQQAKFAEGPVTKKFLTKVHKTSASESHSLGGVMIEQDLSLLQEVKKDVSENVGPSANSASLTDRPRGGGERGGRGSAGRDNRGSGGRDSQRRSGGGGGGGPRPEGGSPRAEARGPSNGGGGGNGGGQGGEGGGARRRRGRRGGRGRR